MIRSIEDLINYLRNFHKWWVDSPGIDPRLIPSDLPYGLALIYRELGQLIDLKPGAANGNSNLFGTQDYLFGLDRLERHGEMIEFCMENQGNWTCRCQAGQVDPAVYSDVDRHEADVYEVICSSLNHFLITLCLQEAVFSAPFLCNFNTPLSGALNSGVSLAPVWLKGKYVWNKPTHNFFEIPGEDILIMGNGPGRGFSLASHTDSVLQFFKGSAQSSHLWPHRNGPSRLVNVVTNQDGTYRFTMS